MIHVIPVYAFLFHPYPLKITHAPIFTIDGDKDSRYTLIAVDPDMPDPEDPTMRGTLNTHPFASFFLSQCIQD